MQREVIRLPQSVALYIVADATNPLASDVAVDKLHLAAKAVHDFLLDPLASYEPITIKALVTLGSALP